MPNSMVSEMSLTKKSKGFTLLEMIIVMGIMGIILATITVYKKRQIEAVGRQNLANVVVGDIYGLLTFANEDVIGVDENGDGHADVLSLDNPLYDKKYVPNGDLKNKTYSQRVSNIALTDEIDNSGNYIQWDNSKARGYFTSKSCKNGNNSVAEGTFFKEYLSCNQPTNSSQRALVLERVDMVGDEQTHSIDRIDFIVAYNPGPTKSSDVQKFSIENYTTAFSEAFAHYGLVYSRADMIYRSTGMSSTANNYGKDWTLLKLKGAASEDDAIAFGSMASHMDEVALNMQQLGIRFSFAAGVGKYLKSDGSVGADNLCWNSTAGTMTHCLKVNEGTSGEDSKGRNDEDGVMHLTAETTDPADKDHTVTGTLMANVVFEGEVFNAQTGKFEQALMTNPVITYESFGNTKGSNSVVIDDPESYTADVADEPGSIQLPVQPCPTLPPDPDNPNLSTKKALMPRMVAAISSIVADAGKSESSDGSTANDSDFADFINSGENRTAAKGLLDHLSGVAIQVNLEKPSTIQDDYKGAYWIISATTGVYDNASGQAVSVINPSSLSVVLTSWCSSIPQPDWEDGGKGARPPKISP